MWEHEVDWHSPSSCNQYSSPFFAGRVMLLVPTATMNIIATPQGRGVQLSLWRQVAPNSLLWRQSG